MQHGIYVVEFERELFRRGFAISHHSLGQLLNQVDFSKLKDFPESDRFSFYELLPKAFRLAVEGSRPEFRFSAKMIPIRSSRPCRAKRRRVHFSRHGSGTSGASSSSAGAPDVIRQSQGPC